MFPENWALDQSSSITFEKENLVIIASSNMAHNVTFQLYYH